MKVTLIAALSAAALLAVLQPAAAESPRAQFAAGVPLEEITCSEGRALLESPRGTPVCILEESVEKLAQRGFVLVKTATESVEEPPDMTGSGTKYQDEANHDTRSDETESVGPKADTMDGLSGMGETVTRHDIQDAELGSSKLMVPADGVSGVEVITDNQKEPPRSSIPTEEPVLVTKKVASDVEFVDDGRKYPEAMQRRPSPQPMYDKIMALMTTDPGNMVVGQSGDATYQSVEHEKYSINPGVGFYPEDWLPTYIPDGYKLLHGGSDYEKFTMNKEHEEYKVHFRFVPTTFVLNEDTNGYDLDTSKGFLINIVKTTVPIQEVEDLIEGMREVYNKDPKWYGSFKDIEREGKPVYAFEGGNPVNPYRSVITWQFADDSYIHIISDYLTLDELIPIFESIRA